MLQGEENEAFDQEQNEPHDTNDSDNEIEHDESKSAAVTPQEEEEVATEEEQMLPPVEKPQTRPVSGNVNSVYVETGKAQELNYPNYEEKYLEEFKRKKEIKLRTLLDKEDAAETYLTNSEQEEQALDFVENFRNQYVLIFPGRKDLLLSPDNEFGIKVWV